MERSLYQCIFVEKHVLIVSLQSIPNLITSVYKPAQERMRGRPPFGPGASAYCEAWGLGSSFFCWISVSVFKQINGLIKHHLFEQPNKARDSCWCVFFPQFKRFNGFAF